MKKIAELELQNTHLVYPIVKDYLNKNKNLSENVQVWQELSGLKTLVNKREFSVEKRNVLVQHLNKQYKQAGIELSEDSLTYRQIQLLQHSDTFTITTGHQLSLFGGTLFMAYKILTAIKTSLLAKEENPDKKFVPILWLASEDHDFEEIKSTYVFGKNFSWEKETNAQATGKLDLEGLSIVIEEIKTILGSNTIAQSWVQKIEQAYIKSDNLGTASIRFYHSLFEEFGLVILDANAIVLKSNFIGVMKGDLLEQKTYGVQAKSDEKLADKYKLQIHARNFNFFYLSAKSGRKLIKKEGEKFVLGESLVSAIELEHEIENHPERFSPNVNLRPVYQESVLPNLAYIGGPAEVAYWLQLKSVFDAYSIPYPMVVLRFMNVMVGKNLSDKTEKMGLKIQDLILDEKDIVQRLLQNSQQFNFNQKMEEILNEFQSLVDAARLIDAQLGKDFLENKLLVKDFFKGKTPTLKKALELKEEVQIEKLLKLRAKLFPQNVFQERIETLLQNDIMLDRNLLGEILEILEPLNGKLLFSEV
jgi:bacillithiol biosynthesis cysteine-adding enzyme BshC